MAPSSRPGRAGPQVGDVGNERCPAGAGRAHRVQRSTPAFTAVAEAAMSTRGRHPKTSTAERLDQGAAIIVCHAQGNAAAWSSSAPRRLARACPVVAQTRSRSIRLCAIAVADSSTGMNVIPRATRVPRLSISMRRPRSGRTGSGRPRPRRDVRPPVRKGAVGRRGSSQSPSAMSVAMAAPTARSSTAPNACWRKWPLRSISSRLGVPCMP
jgi:hypothetical protein